MMLKKRDEAVTIKIHKKKLYKKKESTKRAHTDTRTENKV